MHLLQFRRTIMVKTMKGSNPFTLWQVWQMQTAALPIMVLVVIRDLNLLSPRIQEYQIIITVLEAEVGSAMAEIPWLEILSNKRINFNSSSQPRYSPT
jgi:hypothetical protein